MNAVHQSVLLEETVSLLQPGVGKVIVDGTVGSGGHSEALLLAGATVFALDRDPQAVARARARLARFGDRFTAEVGNYADLDQIGAAAGRLPVDGILLDLGVSSDQIEDPRRGFSFQLEGPLDMRMGSSGQSAAELIESLDEGELASVIRRYGEERFARPIARMLKRALPKTTRHAVEIIERAVPRKSWPKKIHPATRTFQALRIAVNQELDALDRLLASLPKLLKPNGVAAVISFHSLEDRRAKESFRDLQGTCTCPPDLPVCVCGAKGSFRVLTRKAIQASPSEKERNPRARSARLRAAKFTPPLALEEGRG